MLYFVFEVVRGLANVLTTGDGFAVEEGGAAASDWFEGGCGSWPSDQIPSAVIRSSYTFSGFQSVPTGSKTVSSNVLYIHPLYPYFTVFSKRFYLLYLLSLQQRPLNHVLYM
jgi:hypothetical protein